MSDDLIRASGLWLKDGKRGKYMTGETQDEIPAGAKLLLFKNDRKTDEKQPDYQLYFVTREDQPPMRRAEPGQQSATPDAIDDGIPF